MAAKPPDPDKAGRISRKRKGRKARPAKDAKGRISQQRLCELCDSLGVLCVRTNPKDVRKRQGGSDQQKTQSSQSEARRGRKEEESRGSVFVNFAKYLCVLCVRTNAKDL